MNFFFNFLGLVIALRGEYELADRLEEMLIMWFAAVFSAF